jgi:adenylate cyclase
MATARVERRLAAILAADVVGYSRLMERDEAGTLARLKAHREELAEPLIAEHRGRVVKLMGHGAAGDGRARGRAPPLPRRRQPR